MTPIEAVLDAIRRNSEMSAKHSALLHQIVEAQARQLELIGGLVSSMSNLLAKLIEHGALPAPPPFDKSAGPVTPAS